MLKHDDGRYVEVRVLGLSIIVKDRQCKQAVAIVNVSLQECWPIGFGNDLSTNLRTHMSGWNQIVAGRSKKESNMRNLELAPLEFCSHCI